MNNCSIKNYQILLKAKIIELVLAYNFTEARDLLIEVDDFNENEFLSCMIHSEQRTPESSQSIVDTIENYLNIQNDFEEFSLINIYLLKLLAHVRINQEDLAKQSIERLLQISDKNIFILSLIYYRISLIYIANDAYIASKYLEQSLTLLSNNYPNSELYAKILVAKANIQVGYYGNYEEALKITEQSKRIYKKFENSNNYILTLIFEVSIALRRDDRKQALLTLSELDELDGLSHHEILFVNMLKGTTYLMSKNLDQAKFYFEKMYSLMDPQRGIARPNYLSYFKYLIVSKQLQKALNFSKEIGFQSWEKKFPIDEAEKLFYLIKIHKELKDFNMIDDLNDKYQLLISKLSRFSKIKLQNSIKYYETYISNRLASKITIITNQSVQQFSEDQANSFIEDKSKWHIVLNFFNEKIYISNQEIDLSSKSKLLQILKELIAFRGSSISSYDLYEKCWGVKFNPKVDGALKTNISRLRRMLSNHLDQAIIITPKKGYYSLNPLINFCCLIKE